MKELILMVLGPDGRILQTEGAPPEWAGKRIAHAVGLPAAVGRAAAALVVFARTSETWLNRRVLDVNDHGYELVVVEAVPLRRRPIDVADILTRTTELPAPRQEVARQGAGAGAGALVRRGARGRDRRP
ncbi:MAG: hypothetical protein JWP97_5841 [Labilithrix sp.]|nr:hypothetical protein [Labilithrix sp.]